MLGWRGWLAMTAVPLAQRAHLLQAIRARAAYEWPPSMNCRIEKISERRSYGEIGKDARITDASNHISSALAWR
jgi:hypothetical protein